MPFWVWIIGGLFFALLFGLVIDGIKALKLLQERALRETLAAAERRDELLKKIDDKLYQLLNRDEMRDPGLVERAWRATMPEE